MTFHLVVGAGPVGTAIAAELGTTGDDVCLASRSGRGATVAGVARAGVDATDATALTALAGGAKVIYNALNPTRYHRWAAEWPPMAVALLTAAERSGAALATVSNLYGYGRVSAPMREDTELRPHEEKGEIRTRMWHDVLTAHRNGRVRALEVRGSDYLGAGSRSSATIGMAAVVAGRPARVLGKADVPHSWTYTKDVARLIVAAAADQDAYGQAWHVPTNAPRTQRQLLTEIATLASAPAPRIIESPEWVLRLLGRANKDLGAAVKISYQYAAPFVVDDTAARQRFGLLPADWHEILVETVADLKARHVGRTGAVR